MTEPGMTEVWKFWLGEFGSPQPLTMPLGARLLHVAAAVDGGIALWALVDPSHPTVERSFVVLGTGWSYDLSSAEYVGTVRVDWLMWHVFELTEERA